MPDEIEIIAHDPDCIRLLQMTDTHIFASENADYDGVDTRASLKAVINQITEKEKQSDLVLVTGDLVHDPVVDAYSKLLHLLEGLNVPTFCLPGNHDDPDLMHATLNHSNVHTSKIISTECWNIILLDSFLKDSHSGRLEKQELEFLNQSLQGMSEKHVLLAIHHPLVSIDSAWMDAMSLENPEDLFALLQKYANVRGVIWGHNHQEFRANRDGLTLYGSPSTCVQFKPNSEHYIKDPLSPAYSVLLLHKDGRIEIDIRRL
jgi:3',5'-cyclic-AMP phosphodiesterase